MTPGQRVETQRGLGLYRSADTRASWTDAPSPSCPPTHPIQCQSGLAHSHEGQGGLSGPCQRPCQWRSETRGAVNWLGSHPSLLSISSTGCTGAADPNPFNLICIGCTGTHPSRLHSPPPLADSIGALIRMGDHPKESAHPSRPRSPPQWFKHSRACSSNLDLNNRPLNSFRCAERQ